MNKKNIPEIRFSGFDDEWEEFLVKDLLLFSAEGGTPSTKISENYEKGKIPFVKIEDTFNKYIHSANTKITKRGLDTSSAWLIPKNSIIFTNGATVGNISINKVPVSTKQGIMGIILKKNIDLEYAYYSLSTPDFSRKVWDKVTIGTFPWITTKNFNNINLRSTNNVLEQGKIGSLLKNIDDLIIDTEKQYDHYKNIKDTLLNKMFPADYSNIPEIRFKGFGEDWKDEKLENIGWSFTGLQGKTKNDFGHGMAKYITYLNIFNNSLTSDKNLERIEIDNKQNRVEYGDIFFTTSSETIEEAGMSSVWLHNLKNIYLNSFCFGFRLNNINDFNLIFLAYVLRSDQYRGKVKLITQGISRFNVAKSKLLKLDLNLPNLSEQTKIGELFKSLDDLITLTKKKHEKLKNIKNALLNKMFC